MSATIATRLLVVADVACVFGRSARTIRRWVHDGHLSSIRIGKAVFFRPDDVERLITTRLLHDLTDSGDLS